MSNCCANSASVLSPRTAARATFALKAGVWFRRGRFVMVSPVRHTSWPLSGRNSTYPAVQIFKASSIRRIGRGRPRLRPAKLAGDKAYSSRSIRQALRKRGITPVIPTKANERRQPDFDREAYRQRNIVERLINRLKNFRRIATRYEKRAANYLAMIHIAAILLWI